MLEFKTTQTLKPNTEILEKLKTTLTKLKLHSFSNLHFISLMKIEFTNLVSVVNECENNLKILMKNHKNL